MTSLDLLRRTARTAPDRPCVVEGDRVLTFGQVDARADRAAQAWCRAGLAAGDRVAVLAHNEPEHLEWQVAAQRAGLVLVPLNTRLLPHELQRLIDDARPGLLIHGPGLADVTAQLSLPHVWHLGDAGIGEAYDDRLAAAPAVSRSIGHPDAPATLLYTSGTTGSAKAAIITNRILAARAVAVARELRLRPEHVFLQTLPMFHLAQTFSCAFAMVGAQNILMRRFSAAEALAALGRCGVTHTLVVPTVITMLLEALQTTTADLSTLRAILYGGSAMPPTELSRALSAFRCDFYQMYGMTETGPVTLLRPEQHDPQRPELLRSVGSEITTFELKIVDSHEKVCPPGIPGEIMVRGPAVMAGYWIGDGEVGRGLDRGWICSGDVGRRDADGLIYITDRVKDIIISGGENVSPREVEQVLSENPAVGECAVIGLPDNHYGERVHAVVVPAAGRALDFDDLDRHCASALPGFKRPRSYSRRDSLPRTATGKVQKGHLAPRVDSGASQRPRNLATTPKR